MKRVLLTACVMCLGACGASSGPEPIRHVELLLDVVHGSTPVELSRVVFEGELKPDDDRNPTVRLQGDMFPSEVLQPPTIWASPTIELLPSSSYEGSFRVTTFDEAGEPHCSGIRPLAFLPAAPASLDQVDTILVCALPEPLPPGSAAPGLVFGDELVVGNLCPRRLVLAPQSADVALGAAVRLVAGAVDPEQETLSIEWLATGGTVSGELGSFAFHCDEPGAQSITMTVSDGDPYCDKRRSTEVACVEP